MFFHLELMIVSRTLSLSLSPFLRLLTPSYSLSPPLALSPSRSPFYALCHVFILFHSLTPYPPSSPWTSLPLFPPPCLQSTPPMSIDTVNILATALSPLWQALSSCASELESAFASHPALSSSSPAGTTDAPAGEAPPM